MIPEQQWAIGETTLKQVHAAAESILNPKVEYQTDPLKMAQSVIFNNQIQARIIRSSLPGAK